MPASTERIEAVQAESKEEPWTEQEEWLNAPLTGLELRQRVETQFKEILELIARSAGTAHYEKFEKQLQPAVWKLGRLFIALFLCLWHERLETQEAGSAPAGYRRMKPKARLLGTIFGKVRYWRAYLYGKGGRGRFQLDEELKLMADGFSLGLLGRCAQLATKMSYEASRAVLSSFLNWSPAPTSIEEAVLGLGRYTAAWGEQVAAPEGDGEVLVVQADSKAAPTATEQELHKRRQKRKNKPKAPSPRHRGRNKRAGYSPKPRRKKGDKSKNGKMCTVIVMYTLRRAVDQEGKPMLLGPNNVRRYASFAPKRHAMAIARREADKRGFAPGSGKLIQLVTDGDEDLACYAKELFPEATHTLDIAHVVEYLWKAGACLYREGSEQLSHWVENQKARLYKGDICEIVLDCDERLRRIKSSSKRKRLDKILNYLAKRADMMNYYHLCEQDLEIASGVVEGAVRYIVSQRFDEGGMRWIRERAEALLQLRCIELNGHWEQFLDFVHRRIAQESAAAGHPIRLLQDKPQPLPKYGLSG